MSWKYHSAKGHWCHVFQVLYRKSVWYHSNHQPRLPHEDLLCWLSHPRSMVFQLWLLVCSAQSCKWPYSVKQAVCFLSSSSHTISQLSLQPSTSVLVSSSLVEVKVQSHKKLFVLIRQRHRHILSQLGSHMLLLAMHGKTFVFHQYRN